MDPGVRLRAGARLAPEHARLDDQQEALLGPGAADLRLRRRAGRSRSSAAARSCASGRSRAGRRSRATRRTGRGWTRCRSPARAAASRSSGSRTSATRGWTPGSCRSRRSTTARTRTTGRSGSRPTSSPRASPASSATGSTRCSRCRPCSGASRRSRRSSATRLVFGEDGRPMHKSWGNAIEFDEAAERMGVDVMRWMFAKARPEENILFGWHAADEARRELLVLWNVYAFFVTYARLAGWTPGAGGAPAGRRAAARWTAGSCRARPGPRPRSRSGCATTTRSAATRALSRLHRRPVDVVPAPVARPDAPRTTTRPTAPRRSRRSTRRSSRWPGCSRRSCRSCPRRCTRTSSRPMPGRARTAST